MRKYQPIWEALAKNPTKNVAIAAPICSHARIIQAVRKEKCTNIGWRLLLSETNKRYTLDYKVEGKLVTFSLIERNPLNITAL